MTEGRHSISFIGAMAAWGWPDYFHSLSAADLLVMDAASLEAFTVRYGAPLCQTALPETAFVAASESSGVIAVLCEAKERQLVRRLRMAFPGRVVISCSYELASVSGGGELPRPEEIHTGLPQATVFSSPPIVIVSSPYSDAELFLVHLARNGMASAREVICPTLLSLALSRADFDFRRYIIHLFAKKLVGGRVEIHIQTDVLVGLIDAGILETADVATWLGETDARVIYFSRRDKVIQCLVAEVLEPLGLRSVWGMNSGARAVLLSRGQPPHSELMRAFIKRLHTLLQQECTIEAFLAEEVETFRSCTLEELVESPINVLKSMAIFVGQRLTGTIHVPDYGAAYQGLGGIAGDIDKVREDYMCTLGLKRNAAGSLVSATDMLFDRRRGTD